MYVSYKYIHGRGSLSAPGAKSLLYLCCDSRLRDRCFGSKATVVRSDAHNGDQGHDPIADLGRTKPMILARTSAWWGVRTDDDGLVDDDRKWSRGQPLGHKFEQHDQPIPAVGLIIFSCEI